MQSLTFKLLFVSASLFQCKLSTQVSTPFSQVVSQRFPQNSIGAVGSAMFLRFINPAIVSPYEAGILDKKPPPRIERGLKLMSKVNYFYTLAMFNFPSNYIFSFPYPKYFVFNLLLKFAWFSVMYILFLFIL